MRRWLPMLVLVVVTAAALWPVCRHDFVAWDDKHNFNGNPHLREPPAASLRFFWTKPYKDLYVPLTYTVWRSVAAVARNADGTLNPHAFHTLNLVLHVVAALGVFMLIRQLVDNDWAACAGALVFAIHPVQVEPVAWASGTKDVLAGMFGAWALAVHASHLQHPAPAKRSGAVVLLMLALASKPSAMAVVGMAAAIEWLSLHRSLRRMAASLWPWVAVTIPVMVVARIAQSTVNVEVAWWARPLVAADALGFYVSKVLVPVYLGIDYGRAPEWAVSSWQAWAMALLAAITALAVWAAGRRWPAVAVGGAMSLIAILPMLGLTTFDFQWFSTTADRYVYLAMIGVGLVAAAVLSRLPRRWATVAAASVVVGLGVVAHLQTHAWADDQALFNHAIFVNPTSIAGNVNLGNRFLEEARDAWRDKRWQDCWTRAEEANARYLAALAARPNDPDARRGVVKAQVLMGMGALLGARQLDQAIQHFRNALHIDPDDAEARRNLDAAMRLKAGGR